MQSEESTSKGAANLLGSDPSRFSDITNRLYIVVIVTIATAAGLGPATLALRHIAWLPWFVVLSMLTAAITLANFRTAATEVPGKMEFALSALGAVFPFAIGALLWLVVIEVGHWTLQVAGAGANYIGEKIWVPSDFLINIFEFLPPLLLVPVFSNVCAEESATSLYPNLAGAKSAFYSLVTQRRKALVWVTIVALAVLGAVSALVVIWGLIGTGFYVFLEVYLFAIGASAWPSNEKTTRSPSDLTDVEKIAKVFEAAGYRVERFPRTQKAEIDPLLTELDLLVQRGEEYIAIKVKIGSDSSEPADWKTLSGLRTAAWVLLENRTLSRESLRTMLVLVDLSAGKSLKMAARREMSLIVSLTSEEIGRLLQEGSDPSRQHEAVERWLIMPHSRSASSSSRRAAGAST